MTDRIEAKPHGSIAMAKSQPVIFLDMDGVLSTPRAHAANRGQRIPDRWIDPIAVQYLNILCEVAAAVIVVSSSWRLLYERDGFEAFLRRHGFAGPLHADWRTRSLEGHRGDEVIEWLKRHDEIRVHLILDDESDFHPGQPLVKTDMQNGFLYQHLWASFKILGVDDAAARSALFEHQPKAPRASVQRGTATVNT